MRRHSAKRISSGGPFKAENRSPDNLHLRGFAVASLRCATSIFHIIADTAGYRFCAIAPALTGNPSQISASLKDGVETFLRISSEAALPLPHECKCLFPDINYRETAAGMRERIGPVPDFSVRPAFQKAY